MKRNNVSNFVNEDYDYVAGDKKIIYILGPMRGYKNLNFGEFMKYEKILITKDWTVINPADTSPMGLKGAKAYLLVDLMYISEADAVFRLKGWNKSKGAILENAWADFLGLEIIDEI